MGRPKLLHIPNGFYSVVSKCSNNEFLFNEPEKFDLYIEHLLNCKKRFAFDLFDIVCMSNHIHELYRVPQVTTIADILQYVKGQFSKKFNDKYKRIAHFWKNKPFYRIVEDEKYVYNTMNYFHWNPVKAGLARTPEEWPYSGYSFHVLGKRDGPLGQLLTPLSCGITSKVDLNLQVEIEEIFNKKGQRFIGCSEFRQRMKNFCT